MLVEYVKDNHYAMFHDWSFIGTEKDTLVFHLTQIVDGWTDRRTNGKLNSYIAPCYKQVG